MDTKLREFLHQYGTHGYILLALAVVDQLEDSDLRSEFEDATRKLKLAVDEIGPAVGSFLRSAVHA